MCHGITPISKKESTYTNYTLDHFSCIDHIITTQNIFDCIVSNYIISEPCNPSSHNVICQLVLMNTIMLLNCVYDNYWYKADKGHISNYEKCLDYMLCNDIDLYKPVFYCKDWKCECHEHKHEIDMLCNTI